MSPAIEQQMEHLLRNTHFGDVQTAQVMAQELRAKLESGHPLRVYLGVDPTAPDLHLGHAIPIQKLADFQAWGHDCILLIGDFTARIGDPSDKDKTRPPLTREQIQHNVETYQAQAFKLLDPERTTICYNSTWHDKLLFDDLIQLASHFTVAQFLERDNFAKRFAQGQAIHLHEFFYALMQGYDAFALEADVQLGGTDQTFNILAGRRLQEARGQKPQVMLTTPILPGTDGQQKMAKSLGNFISLQTTPEDMYGKVMSLPDPAMRPYFDLLTTRQTTEIDQIFADIAQGSRHPRDVKMSLARQITARLFDESVAVQAEAHFVRLFQEGDTPEEMPEHHISNPINLTELLVYLKLAKSNNAARRLIQQDGVRLDGEKIMDTEFSVEPDPERRVLRVGKRKFVVLV